jgi:hypothetical protein
VIFFMHTPEAGSFMVGADFVPRVGEKMHLLEETDDNRAGFYVIEDVIYAAPSNPDRQRVDVYGRRMTSPADRSYSAVMEARYKDQLAQLSRKD